MDDMWTWNARPAPVEEDEVSFDDLCEAFEQDRWIQALLDKALEWEPVEPVEQDLDEEWFQDMLCECASSASSEPPM